MHPGLDFDRNYADFGEDDDAEFPFLFISFPSAKDPTFADRHPGAQTIEVVTHMPFARFAHWRQTSWQRRGDEYDALKRQFAGRLLAAMYRHVPATEGALKTWELSTPLSTRHFVGSEQGQIISTRIAVSTARPRRGA